jgi:hypothetical protein
MTSALRQALEGAEHDGVVAPRSAHMKSATSWTFHALSLRIGVHECWLTN